MVSVDPEIVKSVSSVVIVVKKLVVNLAAHLKVGPSLSAVQSLCHAHYQTI